MPMGTSVLQCHNVSIIRAEKYDILAEYRPVDRFLGQFMAPQSHVPTISQIHSRSPEYRRYGVECPLPRRRSWFPLRSISRAHAAPSRVPYPRQAIAVSKPTDLLFPSSPAELQSSACLQA